ncbi:phosphate transporter PHO1 homolog 10 isoform X2 [Daucus carota subsp. sativus]|uniref:phosphate transporter PHO1 homolog 10 isoform X2 n=1 Tax=Daucus carota subsp. sativus TaxID=79200 RepID=UPI0007EF2165|nr:PREDICTED: phosphate transporter PHO1 homolog 10-like isoform X2 [Daucus carota subsp. sativus]
MKFGKDFKKQMVPEWIEAYMDYNGLKKILRDIRRARQSKGPPTPSRLSHQQSMLYTTFSGLNPRPNSVHQSKGDIEDQVIDVSTTQQEGSTKLYNTKFLKSNEEGGDTEVTFFNKLDYELNKVNIFYKDKVEEVMKEATELNKQMEALIALRIKVKKPDIAKSNSEAVKLTSPEVKPMDLTPEVNKATASTQGSAISGEDYGTRHGKMADSAIHQETELEVLDRVKMNNAIEDSIITIRGLLNDSKGKELNFNKEELRKAEERLKIVFIEFYRKLRLLKQYSFMNLLAFSKIMKKYEKIASRNASRSYMKIVDSSYLGSSEEVACLLDRVEDAFIKYFSRLNRREGMKSLRPKFRKEKHRVTFFSGFFFGCAIALLVAAILLIEARKVLDKEQQAKYMDNIYPLYSFYAYIVLHMLFYSASIYFWRRYKVNYAFIFGFKQGTELGYREVFLLSTGLAVLVLSTFLVHLHIKMDSKTEHYETYVDLIPLGLACVVLLITICPFNFMYKSSRFFLIRCFFRCICAPLCTITLADFFLADHLTSQVQALRSFEFYTCFYGWGKYVKGESKCHELDVYNVFYFIVAIIPYWIRFLQCVRRLFEEKEPVHAVNGFRYFLTIVAVAIRTAFELKKGTTWKVLAFISSIVAIVFNTYWDIFVDWGLMQKRSKNSFLRDKLLVSHKSVYFAAMVVDMILRFAWLQLVLKFNVIALRGDAITSLCSCLEILRRNIWSFFRLENEHVNNVGKYRAFKLVPLPFYYYDDEKDD